MLEMASHNTAAEVNEAEAAELARRGIVYQIAAEASSETKLLIPADPDAINGPWGMRVLLGLERLAALPEGQDYSGVTADEARAELIALHGSPTADLT